MRGVVALSMAAVICACNESSTADLTASKREALAQEAVQSGSQPAAHRAFSENALRGNGRAARADKQLGESCELNRESACASGLCLKMGTGTSDWRCSRPCQPGTDCGSGFQCQKIFPDPDGFVCVALSGGMP